LSWRTALLWNTTRVIVADAAVDGHRLADAVGQEAAPWSRWWRTSSDRDTVTSLNPSPLPSVRSPRWDLNICRSGTVVAEVTVQRDLGRRVVGGE